MAQMPSGMSWNAAAYPMMNDPMSSMMYSGAVQSTATNNSANERSHNHNSESQSESRNKRRSRSRSKDRGRDKSRDRSNDRRGERRRTNRESRHTESSNQPIKSTTDATHNYDMTAMANMNPLMMNNMMAQQGNMMPMAGGMYPGNMMMTGAGGVYPGNMMPASGMDMMQAGGMEMMGQAQMEMMNATMSGQPMANTSSGTMDMNMMGGMMMDPSMIGMGMSNQMYPSMSADMTTMIPERKELVLKSCKLTPPPPGAPVPPRRPRPLGCRTIFIGGLPDKIKEDIVREIFERFGRIYTLRLSRKNFCHIRYDRENSVDAAMGLSGYRIKLIENEEEEETHTNAGWLHVDYALSRDDQHEYERRQRREQRTQRSPSPTSRIQPFSNAMITQLAEKIKSEENFAASVPTLVAWLERGECSKKNASTFYSMIQATNGQIRRLFNEKMQADEELQQCKERIKDNVLRIIMQLEQVAKVLTAATHQRVWDHFTKPQRKNIETWRKMTEEFQALKDEFNEKFLDDDMDFSEHDDRKSYDNNEQILKIKRENENLQFQLEAYKNEVDVIKAEQARDLDKFKAQFIARQALNNVMGDNKPPLPMAPLVKPPPPPPLPSDEAQSNTVALGSTVEAGAGGGEDGRVSEARLIGVMAAFLQVHPHGASLDYVLSYVRALFPSANQATVHHVLQKHADVFRRATTGVGAAIEHRWSFIAFNSGSS